MTNGPYTTWTTAPSSTSPGWLEEGHRALAEWVLMLAVLTVVAALAVVAGLVFFPVMWMVWQQINVVAAALTPLLGI